MLANAKLSVATRTKLRGLLIRRKKSTSVKKTAISHEEYCMQLVKYNTSMISNCKFLKVG